MRSIKLPIILLILGMFCASGFGRIGETGLDLEKRYGAAVRTDTLGAYQRSVYQKGGFEITVYYSGGASVMEVFAGRFDQPTARKLAVQVAAGAAFSAADAGSEAVLRKATGIITDGEMFWMWTAAGAPMTAAYSPVERTVTFFGKPEVYADIHKAIASQPL
jgi:hypothetical protein